MGARESNAGDDFHFWWAASRALALIEPGTDSRLLTIESLSRVEDPDDDYDAVDVAEYVGGDDLDSATAVVLSQLKYSTRYPNKPWSVSRICEQRTRRAADGHALSKRSVIADLAGIYGRLLTSYPREELLAKVRIRLVGNQPGDAALRESVAAAAALVRSHGGQTPRAALLKGLADPDARVIERLACAIGDRLKSREFCDLLTVLDLSQIGTLGRAAIARSVRAGAAELTYGRGPDSALRLFDLVRKEALPDSSRNGIRAADVLAELGVADVLDLYPAPARLPTVLNPLLAPGGRAVAEAVLARPGGVVLAHGRAGEGKTTAIQQLETHLPPGSIVVLFDCYGGGEYLSSGEERHTPHRFVTQIVNDLAQRCGTPLLIDPPVMEEDLWRRMTRTLSRAVDVLDTEAVLALAVDAADNAAYAASVRGSLGFLPGLLGLPLPPRVTVVLTARSHRVASLAAGGATVVELTPFDLQTSAAHVRRFFPRASDAETNDFHARTGGNPRVQFYVLTQAGTEGWDIAALLAACVTTPEPLFDAIVTSAVHVSGADAGGQRWLALMLALARPITTATLAAALDVDADDVVAFAHGLHPGVEVSDGKIQFRDENFETYVRDRLDPRDVVTAHQRLADMFLAQRTTDADAAAHVADHLFAAGRLDDLLQLVLDERAPEAIPDGFRRAEVQGRRLDLAARAAANCDAAPSAAVRLAVRGCETASRLDTLASLVESHFDLVARYADVDLVRSHALRQNRDRWLAPILMRLAAVLSRDSSRHVAAREALDGADAWLRRWMTGPEEETGGWHVDHEDVACAAEARFRLDGADAAVDELRQWRPPDFALDAAASLAARVAAELGPQTVRDALRAHHVPLLAQGPFLAYAASPQAAPERDWVDDVVTAAIAATPGEPKPWHLLLIDVAARHGDPEAAAALALHWAPELPAHRWAFATGSSDGIATLRSRAVAAVLRGADLTVGDLLPRSLRPQNGANRDDSGAYERNQWTERVEPLLAAALLAAGAATSDRVDAEEVAAFVEAGLAKRTAAAAHRWFTVDDSYRAWAAIAVEAAVDTLAASVLIDHMADAAPVLLRESAPALWLDLASALNRWSAHPHCVAELCARAARHAVADAYPAPDRLDLLARAASIAAHVDPGLGKRLFDQAVDAAGGVNDDAARLLTLHADLAERAAISDQNRASVAASLVQAAEAVTPFVTEADVVPYGPVVGAAARLDAGVALAAASRWDDEDRIRLASTLPDALRGAVDGGGVSVAEALALDHLIDDDQVRIQYRLTILDRVPTSATRVATIRRALRLTADWLRRNVPARNQPVFAQQLLNWAGALGFDGPIRTALDPIVQFRSGDDDPRQRWRAGDRPQEVQALLDNPQTRSWKTLTEDVAVFAEAHVYGDEMRHFIHGVARAAPSGERLDSLAAVTELARGPGGDADTVLPVLAECIAAWGEWPHVADWARSQLPKLLAGHLGDLAWRQDIATLLEQLRAFDDDEAIRRAVLLALPNTRPRLSSFGWHNIARILGRLCGPGEAAEAVTALLRERLADANDGPPVKAPTTAEGPVPLLLWSAFGHPRRAMRWRAAHAARELLLELDPTASASLAGALVACLERADAGPFRDPALHFYSMSAAAALLVALQRVASERSSLLASHLPDLVRRAISSDFPHAQVRELARQTALALADPSDRVLGPLRLANQPIACLVDRSFQLRNDDRRVSEDRRYNFDPVDTLPYWYAPLARVFNLPVDAVAERAERWILDEWGLGEDDWWTDRRELRDQRSYEQMSHRQGSVPPEENLRLYLEHHAMMVAAGELVALLPIHVDNYDDAGDPWRDWISRYLARSADTWVADLRAPVPVEPQFFGHLPPLDEWDTPSEAAFDNALQLVDGRLTDPALVAGHTSLTRYGAYSSTYIRSALVGPDHAEDLQRALAAARSPTDWKLPDEDEAEFEVDHGGFVLRGWLVDRHDGREALDEHDPYAYGLSLRLPMPGRLFRAVTRATPDATGLVLREPDGAVVAQAEQWADPNEDDRYVVTSSGNRLYVARDPLLRFLAETGTTLIVEVQIGRHRSSAGQGAYRPPRSRIYLIDAAGEVIAR